MAEKTGKPRAKKSRSSKSGAGTGARKTKAKSADFLDNGPYRGARRKTRRKSSGDSFFSRRGLRRFAIRAFLICFIIGTLMVAYFAASLPSIEALETIRKQQGITIQTADNRVIANYGDVYGEYIPYEKLPKTLVQAVIATEDRRFFQHHGIDVFGIFRAMVTNIARGHLVQGGSTVTQQVAKNVFLTSERSLSRKVQEVMLAFWLESKFSKKEIMAIYLNRVYLGAGTFGVDAAAHRYFNKSARDLDLFESALMAGLLKAPSRYSPAASVERAKDRVHQVLVNMVDAGYLREKDIAPALASFVKSPAHEEQGGDVRYFTDWILDDIPNYVGQVNEDMVVTTTLSTSLQTAAQDALQNVISMQGQGKNITQGAIVAMEPDGAVKAMIGGLSYSQSQYNRAVQAKRQPGSSFKIFVYLAALEAGYTPESTVTDAPISITVGNKSWTPDNFDSKEYRGDIPMVEALRYSLNTVSVRLSQAVGLGRVASMAERLGIPNVPAYPSIALGAVEATVLEMTGAFAHLANHGNRVVPYGILTIKTAKGKELYKREDPNPERLLAQGTVEMMNYMLIDVARRGTGAKAALAGHPAAGKTGTSQDHKDAWFIGFTPQLVTGVWVGNDDNKSMVKVTGGMIPAVIWHDFMTFAMQGQPAGSIPNSPSNSDGLLPWLFGGSPEPTAPAQSSNPPAVIPADAPFALQHPVAGAPTQAPQTTPAEPAPEQEPAPVDEGEPLPAGFWDKLAKKVPDTVKNQKPVYSYPGQN